MRRRPPTQADISSYLGPDDAAEDTHPLDWVLAQVSPSYVAHHMGMHDQSTHGDRFGGIAGGGGGFTPEKTVSGSIMEPTERAGYDPSSKLAKVVADGNKIPSYTEEGPVPREVKNFQANHGSSEEAQTLGKYSRYYSESSHKQIATAAKEMMSPQGVTSDWSNYHNGAKAILDAVYHAPASGPTLYRGVYTSEDRLASMKPGSTFDISVGSFSTDKSFVMDWAHTNYSQDGKKSVLIELGPGSKSVNVTHYSSFPEESEWLSSGRFKVQSVRTETDAQGNKFTVVRVKQTHVFSAPGRTGEFKEPAKKSQQTSQPQDKSEFYNRLAKGQTSYAETRDYITNNHQFSNHAYKNSVFLDNQGGTHGMFNGHHAYKAPGESKFKYTGEAKAPWVDEKTPTRLPTAKEAQAAATNETDITDENGTIWGKTMSGNLRSTQLTVGNPK